MFKEAALGILRHLLTAGGGYVVSSGLIDAATAQTAIGALMTLAGIAWSVAIKVKR